MFTVYEYYLFQIVNTEWGAFSNGLPLSKFDRQMDADSINPGEQVSTNLYAGTDNCFSGLHYKLQIILLFLFYGDRYLKRQFLVCTLAKL